MCRKDIVDNYDILGKEITIISCSNRFNVNQNGIVVNETKNMIYISDAKNSIIKKIAKKEINTYKINSSTGAYFINGKVLLGRPEERITKTR